MKQAPVTVKVALVAGAAAALSLALLAALGWFGAAREQAARRAWEQTRPFEALARPEAPREANAAALALERSVAPLGIALAPRSAPRAAALAPALAPLAPLATLHADLDALLSGAPASAVAPALAAWLEASRPSLDALSVDLAGGEPPRWESPSGIAIARSPAPLERCDRIVLEAARLQAAAAPLSASDEHLVRPGVPRLDGVVALEEALLLCAIVDGRAGDAQRSLRLLGAAARLEEGVAADADVVTLGVLASLARERLAVLRDLAPPVDAAPLLGPDLEARWHDAVLAEAGGWARWLAAPSQEQAPPARAIEWLARSPARAQGAGTLEGLHAIARVAGPAGASSADILALAAQAEAGAPAWEPLRALYLADVAGTWARLRRLRADADLTRRALAARMRMLVTGDAGLACREIAEAPLADPPATFSCAPDAAGRLTLVMAVAMQDSGRPPAAPSRDAAALSPAPAPAP